jgi:hypothetical protein
MRVFGEQLCRTRNCVARGFVAGEYDQQPEAVEIFVAQQFAVDRSACGRKIRHVLAAKLQVLRRIHVDHGIDRGAEQ